MGFRTLSRNATASVAQVLLSAMLLFELYRFLTRHLGLEEIGVWSLVMASTAIARLSEFGLGGGVVKFVAGDIGAGQARRAARTTGMAAITIAIAVGSGCVLAAPVLHWLLPRLIKSPTLLDSAHYLVPFALASMWLAAIGNVFLSALDGLQRSELRAFVMIGAAAGQVAAAYMVVPIWGLHGLGPVQLVQAGLMLMAAAILLLSSLRHPLSTWIDWDKERFKELLRYGAGVQVAAIGQLLFEPTVKALLSLFGGLTMTGYYELANRAITQFRAVIVSGYQALVPYMATRAGREVLTAPQMRSAYLASFRLLVLLATPYYALLGGALPLVLTLWIGRFDETFIRIGMICLVGWYLNTMVVPAYMLYLAAGRLRWTVWSHVTIGVLSAVLGSLGGLAWGGVGVIAGAMLALVVGSGLVIVAFHSEHKLRLPELVPPSSAALLGVSLLSAAVIVGATPAWDGGLGDFPFSVLAVLVAVALLQAWLFWRHPVCRDLVARWRHEPAARLSASTLDGPKSDL